MIKLWEPVVRIIFYEINLALNRYKTCAVSVSDRGKEQFTANQSIYRLLDKDLSVPDDIDLWRSVWTRLYCLKVFSRCICSRVSLISLLLYIAAPPTFYQIFMNNGLFQKTKVEFPDWPNFMIKSWHAFTLQ